jgi:uncharacterized protein with beta-barrel porin domain
MLTIGGNLTFQPGGLYLVQVNPANASLASVTANGTASLSGTVQAIFSPGSYFPRSYDILWAARRSGTFAALTTVDLPAGFTASLSSTATDVLLDLNAGLGAGWLNVNQHNVANAINSYFNNGGTLPPGFLKVFGLTSGVGTALSELSGEAATGAQAGAFQMMSSFMSLLLDPYAQNRGGFGQATGFAPERGTLPAEVASASASVLKAPPADAPTFNVWAAGFGGANRTAGDPVAGSHDAMTHAAGSAAGVDYRLSPDTLLGFALAGGASSWSLSDGLGGGRSDAFQAGAYGIRRLGSAYVSGALAFAEYWASTSRTVTVAGTDTLAAAFNAQSYGARLESGTHILATPFMLTPYGALQAQRFDAPAHDESATSGSSQFALSYAAQTATQTRAELGSWADTTFVLAGGGSGVNVFAHAAWAHDWQSDPFLGAAFLGLPAAGFVVNGAAPPHNLALMTAGAELRLHNGWSLLGKLDGELGKGAQTGTGTGQLRCTW